MSTYCTVEDVPKNFNFKNMPELKLVKITPKESTRIGNIEFKPRSQLVMKNFVKTIEELQDFKVREDDVWITTFPKCGTTWMQEMCWLILNNYDFKAAKQRNLEIRSPFLEYNGLVSPDLLNTVELLEQSKSPRLIKTHLSIRLLPKDKYMGQNAKIIHVVRDPRDAVVSQYHLLSSFTDATIEEFAKAFMDGFPFFNSSGTYWSYNLDFWKLRNNPNYLFVNFEEMKTNLSSVIKKVCSFLKKPINEEQITKMLEHLSFENMKDNDMVNHSLEIKHTESTLNFKMNDIKFIRKGLVGSHKTEFSPELSEIFNEWVRENLKDTQFPLYLED